MKDKKHNCDGIKNDCNICHNKKFSLYELYKKVYKAEMIIKDVLERLHEPMGYTDLVKKINYLRAEIKTKLTPEEKCKHDFRAVGNKGEGYYELCLKCGKIKSMTKTTEEIIEETPMGVSQSSKK